jgi:hypothetical protein
MNPGERLGPYEILSRIGEGGMGQIRRCEFGVHHTRTGPRRESSMIAIAACRRGAHALVGARRGDLDVRNASSGQYASAALATTVIGSFRRPVRQRENP